MESRTRVITLVVGLTALSPASYTLSGSSPGLKNDTQAITTDPKDFYYFRDKPVRLDRSPSELVVRFTAAAEGTAQKVVETLSSNAGLARIPNEGRTFYLVTIPRRDGGGPDIDQLLGRLRSLDEVEFVAPVFYDPATRVRMLPTDELLVKLKPATTTRELAQVAAARRLTIVKTMAGTGDEFVLRLGAPKMADPLEEARGLFEGGLFEWAEPNFIQQFRQGTGRE